MSKMNKNRRCEKAMCACCVCQSMLALILFYIKKDICIAPTQPYWAALGAESRVCYPGNTADSPP
jgi:hypothetical protein